MQDFEYTVAEDFTMRLSDDGAIRSFKVGDHITDPALIAIVEERHIRQVSRHYPRPTPPAAPKPPAPAPAAPKVA